MLGPSSKASEKIDKKSLKIFERALCSVQQIQIIGFIMTKESFGARVKLDEDQLKIYDQVFLTAVFPTPHTLSKLTDLGRKYWPTSVWEPKSTLCIKKNC